MPKLERHPKAWSRAVLAAVLAGPPLLLGARSAAAADGILEINQACAVDTGCFPGDGPGFPVTISGASSTGLTFRLTGPLVLPTGNTTGISIAFPARALTVDLNGFSIRGPSTPGTGDGISIGSDANDVTIRNGTVMGAGDEGITSAARGTRLEQMRVVGNRDVGIILGLECSVVDSSVRENLDTGIIAAGQCEIARNAVVANAFAENALDNDGGGILSGPDSRIVGNVVDGNGAFAGIRCCSQAGCANFGRCIVENNVASGNRNNGIWSGGVISGNTASNNGNDGIIANFATVVGNAADGNGGSGLTVPEGTVVQNTANDNTGFGGRFGEATGYVFNRFARNNGGNANPQTILGLELGENVCGTNLACP